MSVEEEEIAEELWAWLIISPDWPKAPSPLLTPFFPPSPPPPPLLTPLLPPPQTGLCASLSASCHCPGASALCPSPAFTWAVPLSWGPLPCVLQAPPQRLQPLRNTSIAPTATSASRSEAEPLGLDGDG